MDENEKIPPHDPLSTKSHAVIATIGDIVAVVEKARETFSASDAAGNRDRDASILDIAKSIHALTERVAAIEIGLGLRK